MMTGHKVHQLTKHLKHERCKIKDLQIQGPYVHIDTHRKYHDRIHSVMESIGYKLTLARGGTHADGLSGYRMVFQSTKPQH